MPSGPQFEPHFLLEPPSHLENLRDGIKRLLLAYVYVDVEWFRMMCFSLLPAVLTIIARLVGRRAATAEVFLFTTAWVRVGSTLALLTLTWLLASGMGEKLRENRRDDHNNWTLLASLIWAMTVALLASAETVLAVDPAPTSKDQFAFGLIMLFSIASVMIAWITGVVVRKVVTRQVVITAAVGERTSATS